MSYKDYTQKNAPWDSDSWTEDERTQWAQDDTAYHDYGVTRCLGCMELHSREYEICPECGYVSGMMPENPLHIYPGTYLKNRYIIGKVIGSGGFGITYIAWDTLLKTKVAVKEYLPSEFSTRSSGQTKVTVFTGDKTVQFTDGKDKFVDEAKRLAKFQNESGIVKIFDSFEENNTAYIIMEYLDGCTLGEYLDMNGKMDADKAIELITPVIESLNSVHEVGIIHRDVAPDNIFVTKNGDVKLIDFGASRYATTSKSRSLSVLIKPGYSPEEQYRSRGDQGAHTDVYSLAATLYKMITGVTPPDALERRAFYEKKKKDILEPITKYNKEITDNQQTAIYNALNIKIEDRTPNTVTLLGELTSETKVKRNKGTLKKIDPLTWPLWLKIGIPAALVVFITLGILLATGVIGPKRNVQVRLKDGYVEMPDYIGMNCEEAANDLANLTDYKGNPANLELSRKDYIQGGREGTVVKTEPSGGMAVKMGISPEEKSVIYYYESEGTPVTVPYIHGIPYDEAIFVDFEITVIILHSNVQSGCIISAEINGTPVYGGSNAQKYDKITVYVSDGPEDPDMGGTVIDFTGMTFSEAMMEAEKHNLCIRADEAAGQSNTVVGQSVAPGRWVSSGEVIVLSFKEDSTRVIPAYWDGKNKNTLKAELIRAGFTNVELVAGGDVGYGQDTVYEMRDGDGNIINGNDRLHKDTVIILYYDPTPDVVAESVDREEVTETEYVAEPETTRRQPTEPPVTEPETEYYYPEEESSDYDYDYTEYPSHGYSEVYTEYPTEDPWPDERPTETVYKQYWFDYNHENASVPELYVLSLYDSLPSAYRDGYEFLGWFTGESAGEEIHTTHQLIFSENVVNNTVYAHWRQIEFSDWSDTLPANVNSSEYEIEYRYRDMEYTSSSSTLSGWGQPYDTEVEYGDWVKVSTGQWKTTSITSYERETEKTVIESKKVYRYYYYGCKDCGNRQPNWGEYYPCRNCGNIIGQNDGHYYWTTISYKNSNSTECRYFDYNKSQTTSVKGNELWFFSTGNLNDTAIGTNDAAGPNDIIQTGYREIKYTRTKTTTYYYSRWETDWTYSSTPVNSYSDRQIQYRYRRK